MHHRKTLILAAIALAQASTIPVRAADVSAEARAAVEKAVTELGCSMDVNDEVQGKWGWLRS
jgi:hypothetical protein